MLLQQKNRKSLSSLSKGKEIMEKTKYMTDEEEPSRLLKKRF